MQAFHNQNMETSLHGTMADTVVSQDSRKSKKGTGLHANSDRRNKDMMHYIKLFVCLCLCRHELAHIHSVVSVRSDRRLGSLHHISFRAPLVAASAIGVDKGSVESVQDDHEAVYVHGYYDADCNHLGNPIVAEASGDQSEFSLCLSKDGSTVVIGSCRNVGANTNASGHFRVFQWVLVVDNVSSFGAYEHPKSCFVFRE
jgi:hypothetical protein